MTKRYRSRAMASVHETAEGLHEAGLVDKQTLRMFDEACLTPCQALADPNLGAGSDGGSINEAGPASLPRSAT